MSAPTPLVAHVVYRFAVGGLENGLVNLINRLPATSWRHAVISLTDIDAAFARRIERDDVAFVALHKRPGHALPLYPALYRWFRGHRPAIVHTRNLAALEATLPAWAAGVPAIIHGEHGRDVEDPDGTNVRRQWIRRAFRPFVGRHVALSPDLERYLAGPVRVPRGRIEQIYNGVDTERFRPARTRAPIPGCPFDPAVHWIIGTVGRLERIKDHANLARAFVAALEQVPRARARLRLVIAGEGQERAAVERILDEAGVRGLAWLPGTRDDVPQLLAGLDCFVLPSRGEGVSNTILEAMACGLPVIATAVGANADLVIDGVTGRVVPADDSARLGDAIAALASAPTEAARMGFAGRLRAERRFSLQRMVDRYHRLYLRALPGQPSRQSAAGVTPVGPSNQP